MNFVTTRYKSLLDIKEDAKRFDLVVVQSCRRVQCDRVSFGLRHEIRKLLKLPKRGLFCFNKNKQGLFSCGVNNVTNVTQFMKYQEEYLDKTGVTLSRLRPIRATGAEWTDEEISYLIKSRCASNPGTFKNIARSLTGNVNRSVEECINKWNNLFPSGADVNNAAEYLRQLKRKWGHLYFHPEKKVGTDIRGHPQLVALHIIWPWSAYILKMLSPSIFCDTTYDATVYNYKVVMLSTFDGNNQHRPLMCSFVMSSTATQWATIFDIFHTRYV